MKNKKSKRHRSTLERTSDRAAASEPDFALEQPELPAAAISASRPKPSSSSKKPTRKRGDQANILSYRHTEKRKNNPHVGLVSPETDPEQEATA